RRPGVWHSEARRPEWKEGEPWRPEGACYARDDGERLVLFDPLALPPEIERLAAEREPVIVLLTPWHERGTQDLVERLGGPVFVPQPDKGSPDVAWLLGNDAFEAHVIAAGDRLPIGAETFPGRQPND